MSTIKIRAKLKGSKQRPPKVQINISNKKRSKHNSSNDWKRIIDSICNFIKEGE